MEITRNNRIKAIERQVARLERQIARFEIYNRRFSWIRLAVFLCGGLATWAGAAFGGYRWGWAAFFASVGIFSIVVAFHRRLDRRTERLKIAQQMRSSQAARMNLSWEQIPEPKLSEKRLKTPLELDLDLTGRHSLHQLMDMTTSCQGSELLAGWLAQEALDLGQVERRQAVVRELIPLTRFRDRLYLIFHMTSKEPLEGEKLVRWLGAVYPVQSLSWSLPLAAFFVAANLSLFLLSALGRLPPYWIAGMFLYAVFYFSNIHATGEFLEAIVELDEELHKFQPLLHFLETYPYRGSQSLAQLCASFHDPAHLPSVLLRKIRLITGAVGLRSHPVFGLLLNLILPWDFFFAFLAVRSRQEAGRFLPLWLETFHQLDALISLANFAYLNPDDNFPEISAAASPVFQAECLRHPLIPAEQRVSNDFSTAGLGEIAIITGSNMAGKSTFIKTVGINLCMAYAGGVTAANALRARPFRLHTCIHITDSVTESFSYFYAEVKCLKRLLERLKSADPLPLLYLIDEIFRGTNNRERLIGSQAYVQTLLGGNGIGLLATHDLELARLAERNPRASNYHFRDFIEDGRLVFDYKIRPGPSPTTNALKIMQIEGLPVEPVE